jgi:hypothetical protein
MLDLVDTARRLNTDDRCDRCGAQAYFLVTKGDSELLFCGHHAAENGPVLMAAGWSIHRDELADGLTAPA